MDHKKPFNASDHNFITDHSRSEGLDLIYTFCTILLLFLVLLLLLNSEETASTHGSAGARSLRDSKTLALDTRHWTPLTVASSSALPSMTGRFQIFMHFPTPFPRSSESPSASVQHLDSTAIMTAQDAHLQEYDGLKLSGRSSNNPKALSFSHIPIARNRTRSSLELRPQPRSRPGIPVFATKPPPNSDLNVPGNEDMHNSRPSSARSLRYRLPVSINSSTGRPRRSTSCSSGRRHAGSKKPEIKQIFSRKTPEPERLPSPSDAEELQKMKQKLNVKTDTSSEPSSTSSGGPRNPRARLAAHLARAKETQNAQNAESGNNKIPALDTAQTTKARLAEVQRRRKMRRARAGSTSIKSRQTCENSTKIPVQDVSSKDETGDSIRTSAGQEETRTKLTVQDHLEARREAKELGKYGGPDWGVRNRAGSFAKQLSTAFSLGLDEKDSGTARKRTRSFLVLDDRTQQNSPLMEPISSFDMLLLPLHGYDQSKDDELSLKVLSDLRYEESGSLAEQYPSQSHLEVLLDEYYIHERPHKHYMQVMCPPRPLLPHFKPTLSPVSSHSAVPTDQQCLNHPRSCPISAVESSTGQSADFPHGVQYPTSLRDYVEATTGSENLHHDISSRNISKSDSSTSTTQTTASIAPQRAQIPERRATSALRRRVSGSMASKESTIEKNQAHLGSSSRISGSKPVPGMDHEATNQILRSKSGSETSGQQVFPPTLLQIRKPEPKFSQLALSRSESISLALTPTPPNISPRSATTSALKFWQDADESLHPSESASAQAPNHCGERPSDFWKLADASLPRCHDDPMIEEWISRLPSFGFALGLYGTNDGALDFKVFDGLKTKRKLQKSRPGSSASRSSDTKSTVEELIDQNISQTERPLAEAERSAEKAKALARIGGGRDGWMSNEAKTIKALQAPEMLEGTGRVLNIDSTPLIADPSLLHSTYAPGTASNVPLSARIAEIPPLPSTGLKAHPQSRLGKEVASRLGELEKYWDEQSIVMGTVLKRMLVVVDNLIVKEREEAQRRARLVEMRWADSDDEGKEERTARRRRAQAARERTAQTVTGEDEWGCNIV